MKTSVTCSPEIDEFALPDPEPSPPPKPPKPLPPGWTGCIDTPRNAVGPTCSVVELLPAFSSPAIVVAVFFWLRPAKTISIEGTALESAGAGQTIDLPDGTVVALSAATRLRFATWNEKRVVTELDHGEMTLDVRHLEGRSWIVSTGAFGDITEGNIGDFVKFLPGVTIDYVSPDARTISVRGLPANYTPVSIDGFRIASANSSAAGRTLYGRQRSSSSALANATPRCGPKYL